MNDYQRGALEALIWAKITVKELKDKKGCLETALEEIENTIEDINAGVAVDFRERVKRR